MLHVLIDYPASRMTIHGDSDCKYIRMHAKPNQRIIQLNVATLSAELAKFANNQYKFTPSPLNDDLWLDLDFNNAPFERAVAEYILHLLSRQYIPLRRVTPRTHC